MDYIAISNIIGDDLLLPDGTQKNGILGGAGTYAVAGMCIWAEQVGIVSGVGGDFEQVYGKWFRRNNIDTAGLHVRDPNTPRSRIVYETPDRRSEIPQFGPEHFLLMQPEMQDVPPSYGDARGIYIFRDTQEDFWSAVLDGLNPDRQSVIWEIHAGATDASNWNQVSKILPHVDLFSINLPEAQQLCQLTEADQLVRKFLSAGVQGVALRLGSLGTIVADASNMYHIPAFNTDVVDVTGAGNAFSGGFLVGYCQDERDILTAGQFGNISASFMLEQFGPPSHITSQVRETARARLQTLKSVPVKEISA